MMVLRWREQGVDPFETPILFRWEFCLILTKIKLKTSENEGFEQKLWEFRWEFSKRIDILAGNPDYMPLPETSSYYTKAINSYSTFFCLNFWKGKNLMQKQSHWTGRRIGYFEWFRPAPVFSNWSFFTTRKLVDYDSDDTRMNEMCTLRIKKSFLNIKMKPLVYYGPLQTDSAKSQTSLSGARQCPA